MQEDHYLLVVQHTSALAYGGYNTTQQDVTESWNGTNWTEVNDLNEAKYALGGEWTSNSSALAFGGQPGLAGSSVKTEVGMVLTEQKHQI